jgi:hypothetical protein
VEAPNKRKRDKVAEVSGGGAEGAVTLLPADEVALDEQFGTQAVNPATDAYILSNTKSPWANRTVTQPCQITRSSPIHHGLGKLWEALSASGAGVAGVISG